MKHLLMNDGWKLHEAPLSHTAAYLSEVLAYGSGWLDADLPCDVRMPLLAAGKIKDPLLADYSFESEWIEQRSWWFTRSFTVGDLDRESEICELVIESIDSHADIFLNGTHIGRHISAHYPFTRDVKRWLADGENLLAVRVTTGLESVSEADLADLNWAVCSEASNNCPERGDRRRAFVRRPQYSTGWDWGPKVATCGIMGSAHLDCISGAVVRGANLRVLGIGNPTVVQAAVEVELLDIIASADAAVTVTLSRQGRICAKGSIDDALLKSGINFEEITLEIENAELWWPNGMGEQPLYEVQIGVECRGVSNSFPGFSYGVRSLSLDTSRQDEKARNFTFLVNGIRMFCKGADWIPCDSIYARVTDEKYDTLVSEAANANFNMLRVWGGGVYERDAFYDACSRHGILIWHDFMFGCSTYPDHLDWFVRECEREMEYQTKRLRNCACLALFCGNNENHWIFNAKDNPKWSIDIRHDKQFGLKLSNDQAVRIVRANCPQIPYWNSSPYGGELPNDDYVGDVHHWHACMMNPDVNLRIDPFAYDRAEGRFISEYGYPGPTPIESIREYFDGKPIDRTGRVWDLHNNTFEKHTVSAGIERHYGISPQGLGLDDYILYAGMVQSTMLGYSLEAFRFRQNCGGGLFWMYNDTWGEVGWTIIDYYLRRKIAYYGVLRAFEPVKAMLRRANGRCGIVAANDTPEALTFNARIGYLSFDGKKEATSIHSFTLPSHSRVNLGSYELDESWDLSCGAFVFIPENCEKIKPALLRTDDMKALKLAGGKPIVVSRITEGQDALITVMSTVFVHAVHFKADFKATDNYFDLLPGERRTIRIMGAAEAAIEMTCVC